jgi:hypothetical protein
MEDSSGEEINMKSNLTWTKKLLVPVSLALVAVVSLLPACGGDKTVTVTAPPVTVSVTIKNPFSPPTVEELNDKHFTYPEMQRITGDRVYAMILEANASGRTQNAGTYIVYDDFQIIDVRYGVLFKKPGRIAGAVNFPLSYYWVLDPQQDPKQEEVTSYTLELQQLEDNLPTLNRDLPLIFYDETSNDQAACMVVRLFQELNVANNWGFDPKNMWVLTGGFYHYTLDLGHPWVFGDAEDYE